MAPPQRGQLRQPAASDLTIWRCTMPTLSQRLGSFPSESRAEIFIQCIQDFPLPLPINIGGFHGLMEDKIGSKISQKISFSPVFLPANVLSSLSLSARYFFSPWRPHRNIPPPPTGDVSASPWTQILTSEVFPLPAADFLLLLLLLSSSVVEHRVFSRWTPHKNLSPAPTNGSPVVEKPLRLSPLLPLLLLPSADFFLLFLFQLQPLQPTQAANSTAVSNAGFRSSSPASQPSPPRQVVHYPSPSSSSSPWEFHYFERWNVNYNSRPQFQWTKKKSKIKNPF